MDNPFRRRHFLGARSLFGALLVLLLPCALAAPSDPAPTLELIGSNATGAPDNPEEGAVEEVGFDEVDLIFLSVPGYFLLQAALTFSTRRGWRIASLVPACAMAPILATTVIAFAAQSNLWPIPLLLAAPVAFLYLVFLCVLLLLYRLATRV
jgi:hypothetical protein